VMGGRFATVFSLEDVGAPVQGLPNVAVSLALVKLFEIYTLQRNGISSPDCPGIGII